MNNFINKLSNREVGFIYLFLYIIIGYFYNTVPFVTSLNFLFTLTPVVMIIRVWLLISGLIKIFSKKIDETNVQQKDSAVNKKRLVESIIYIILGVLGAISFFLVNFLCTIGLKASDQGNCGFILIYSAIILVPITIAGIVFIIIGIVKLNKYFKYKKLQQIFPEEIK